MQKGSISLPVKRREVKDSEGFRKEQWEFLRGIRADFKDATRNDEILASQCGYTASVVAEIAACAYNGASFFVNEATGEIYDIKRTYCPERSRKVQLTGERREHGKI